MSRQRGMIQVESAEQSQDIVQSSSASSSVDVVVARRFAASSSGSTSCSSRAMAIDFLTPMSSTNRSRGRVARVDPLGDLGLQESGRALQSVQAELLLRVVPHDRDVDLGLPHVGRDLDVGHGHVLDARVLAGR